MICVLRNEIFLQESTYSFLTVSMARDEKEAPGPYAYDMKNEYIEDTTLSKTEARQEFDAKATTPDVTRESFAHLDEKKILRKMDLRLLPMLTLLYLLSFIDVCFSSPPFYHY